VGALWHRLFDPKAAESTKRFAFRLSWQIAFVTLAMLAFVTDYTSAAERIAVLALWALCLAILIMQAVARSLHGRR
jgi:hypothetical protein